MSYTHTPQGRMKTMTTTGQAGNSATTWSYDPERGWLTAKRYADNKGPDYTYTPAGRLETRVWARNITTTHTYNTFGDLETVTYSADGQNREYEYDRRGRLAAIEQGDATWTYDLSEAGRILEESIDGGPLDGLKVAFDYDETNRVTEISPEANAAVLMEFAYDGASRLLTAATGAFEAEYAYAENSSIIEEITFRHNAAVTGRTTRGEKMGTEQ